MLVTWDLVALCAHKRLGTFSRNIFEHILGLEQMGEGGGYVCHVH